MVSYVAMEPDAWFVMKVFYNRMNVIERILAEKGVSCWVPYIMQSYIVGGKRVERRRPLCSLLFFHCTHSMARTLRSDLTDKAIIYQRPGVSPWEPMPVPTHEFDVFKIPFDAQDRNLELIEDLDGRYTQGERVRVTGGPFMGAEGVIARIRGDRRLVVSIKGVCAIATSYIPMCYIEKIQ